MAKHNTTAKPVQPWRLVVTFVLVSILLAVLFSHRSIVRTSLYTVSHANPGWLCLALTASALTFLLAACIYQILSLYQLHYRQTILIELAASFANRLLPAGLGGIGLHGLYLHRHRHTLTEATAVVSINNAIGITAHLSLLTIVCLVRPHVFKNFSEHWRAVHWLAPVALLLAIASLLIVLVPVSRRVIGRFMSNLLASFKKLRPLQIGKAYGMAILLTLMYSAVLYGSAHALQLQLPFIYIFIIFSIGMLAGTATPTPGGLVGIEAGLYAGFLSYGVPSPAAIGATLLYRLCTYWLPLLPGLMALLLVRHTKLV